MDGIINEVLIREIENELARREFVLRRRQIRDHEDPFQIPEAMFIKYYRFTKQLARDLIEIVRPFMRNNQRVDAVPIEIKVLTMLYFVGHGSYQKCVGISLCLALGQSTVSRVLRETTDAMTNREIRDQFIKFPQTVEEINQTKEQFYQRYGFPNVIGAVDGSHVAIFPPKTNDPVRPGVAYLNRKGFHSLNVQVVCDANLVIQNCNARFPGSSHDSAIWALSAVRNHLEHNYDAANAGSPWLIGDSGYPLEPWLLTPIEGADINTPEGRYTAAHIATRNCVERCFGVLKNRFRCLLKHRVLHYHPVRAAKMVTTCAILHNICVENNMPEPLYDDNGALPDDQQNDLPGFNQSTAYSICNPKAVGFLDKCPLLWYKYNEFGYVTGYAEDAAKISTFNYYKKGFIKRPTDYYFRPYIMATEKLNKGSSALDYCTGPETAGERIINLVKDFSGTFKNNPNFGFFWMNTYSHNDISTPTMMDNKLKTLLTDLEHSGVTENTLIIFLSDHGIRFGEIRRTETGWLEERLPFIYFSFPPWFKETFPKQYENFKNNEYKFTTPYDLHMTLQHILVLSGFNYTIKPSDACPKCMSLLEEIPTERSCEDANIEDHWCTCVAYTTMKLAEHVAEIVSDFVINELNKIIEEHYKVGGDKCAKYTSASMSTRSSHKFSYKNTSSVLVNIRTFPKAVFETTVTYEGDIMKSNLSMGPVSRLDYYLPNTGCVSDAYLKKLCYCR